MYCKNCGKEIQNDMVFCPVCGTKLKKETYSKQNNLFKICPKCKKQYLYDIDHCSECGYSTDSYKQKIKNLAYEFNNDADKKNKHQPSNIPKCPKCGSTAITVGQRGYTLLTGFLGSNKTVNRCANCGHTWKPGK